MKASLDHHSCLVSLKAEFEAFRSQSRSHARIPGHLRRAALEILASGLEPSLVTTTLGVTSAQVAVWRRRMMPREVVVASDERPRVLDVIPSMPRVAAPTGLRVSYEGGRLLLEFSF